jgi:hypothetical protein
MKHNLVHIEQTALSNNDGIPNTVYFSDSISREFQFEHHWGVLLTLHQREQFNMTRAADMASCQDDRRGQDDWHRWISGGFAVDNKENKNQK